MNGVRAARGGGNFVCFMFLPWGLVNSWTDTRNSPRNHNIGLRPSKNTRRGSWGRGGAWRGAQSAMGGEGAKPDWQVLVWWDGAWAGRGVGGAGRGALSALGRAVRGAQPQGHRGVFLWAEPCVWGVSRSPMKYSPRAKQKKGWGRSGDSSCVRCCFS